MPLLNTTSATGGDGMLCNENRVPSHRRLFPIIFRELRCYSGFNEIDSVLPDCINTFVLDILSVCDRNFESESEFGFFEEFEGLGCPVYHLASVSNFALVWDFSFVSFFYDNKIGPLLAPTCGTFPRTNSYFTASFKGFPAINFGTLIAAIYISSPVRGFLPLRAFLFVTLNVPNPTNDTVSPFPSASVMLERTTSTAVWASFLVFKTSATALTKSALFMFFLLSLAL
jgi:hypothetical protein